MAMMDFGSAYPRPWLCNDKSHAPGLSVPAFSPPSPAMPLVQGPRERPADSQLRALGTEVIVIPSFLSA